MALPNLTSEQFDELIQQYVEIKVDRMSHKDLVEHVTQDLNDYYSDWSIDELETIIDSELFDELVDNVTELTTQEQLDYINSNLKEVN